MTVGSAVGIKIGWIFRSTAQQTGGDNSDVLLMNRTNDIFLAL